MVSNQIYLFPSICHLFVYLSSVCVALCIPVYLVGWRGVCYFNARYWLLKRKIVYKETVITWENIYNLSGKAGNKLHTQCLHKYLKTKRKTNKKLCIGRVLEGNMPSYLQLSGWWETGSFYFCHSFLCFCIFPIFYGKHAQLS